MAPIGKRLFALQRADKLKLHPPMPCAVYRGVRYTRWDVTSMKPGSIRRYALYLPAVDAPTALAIEDRTFVVDASEVVSVGHWEWYVLLDELWFRVASLIERGLLLVTEAPIEGADSVGPRYGDPREGYDTVVPWEGAVIREVWVGRDERGSVGSAPRVIGGLPVG